VVEAVRSEGLIMTQEPPPEEVDRDILALTSRTASLSPDVTLLLLRSNARVARQVRSLVAGRPEQITVQSIPTSKAARGVGSEVGVFRDAVGDGPLITLIGTADKALGLEAIRHGADDYLLLEDLAPELLHDTIDAAIERDRYRKSSQSSAERDSLAGDTHREGRQVGETWHVLSAIVESSADAIFSKTLDGTILTWNRGAAALYGYHADEAIGRHVSLLDPHGDSAESTAILTVVAAGETVRGLETVRRRRDGLDVEVSLTVSPVYDEAGAITAASVIGRDITDRKRLEQQLSRQATYDALTGLPNRLLLDDRIAQSLAAAARHGATLAVLFLDLDLFSPINARYGYAIGDQLLVEVAQRLQAVVDLAGTVARIGSDEFVIICEATEAEAASLADRISDALTPVINADRRLHITVSIGVAVAPPVAANPDSLLRSAQAAMFDAKARGRARWRSFDPSTEERASERREQSQDLKQALDQGTIEVHYQPVVEIATGRLLGVEALARWPHASRGWISPTIFVPLAEESGLVAALDEHVLTRACQDAAKLRAWAVLPEDGYVAVNVSARNLGDGGLVDRVRGAAATARLPLDSLELEVTETGLMSDARGARQALESLREQGVGVALDDFGTGYSSLTYLRQLPVTSLKVDRAFVQHITSRGDDLAITASIIDLGRAVDVRTIAEGVETTEQLALLHRLGCTAGQGFLWSKALPLDELAILVRQAPLGFQPAAATPNLPWGGRRGARVTNEHGLHRIRRLHNDGASLATIAAALNAQDFHTPAGLRWHNASVARVLAELAYAEKPPTQT
jgi:diguanylate cyclase (GGDEF)-like protein/PAS domain S-box-containing protein